MGDPAVMSRKQEPGRGTMVVASVLLGLSLLIWGFIALLIEGGGLERTLIVLCFILPVPLLGAIFTFVGLMAFRQSGIEINRREGTCVTWWGLLFNWRREVYFLGRFTRIVVSRQHRFPWWLQWLAFFTRHGHIWWQVRFPVCLEGAHKPVCFHKAATHEEARKTATELAQFLNLPLADLAEGRTHPSQRAVSKGMEPENGTGNGL